jgi:hypothetical protein
MILCRDHETNLLSHAPRIAHPDVNPMIVSVRRFARLALQSLVAARDQQGFIHIWTNKPYNPIFRPTS